MEGGHTWIEIQFDLVELLLDAWTSKGKEIWSWLPANPI